MYALLLKVFASVMGLTSRLTKIECLLQQVIVEQASQRKIIQSIADNTVPPPAVKIVFTVKINGGKTLEGIDTMLLKDNQQFTASVAFQDALGNPATAVGVPAWTNNNTNILSMVPAADGLSAVVSAIGPVGSGQISVQADPGDSKPPIIGTLDVQVVAGDATVVTINTGPATDNPAPAPAPAPAGP